MEEIDSLWSYQETMDEMKQKLLYTSLEVERLNMEASEEKRKNNQLIHLIKLAYQERDEAKNHLHKLLNKINQSQINNIDSSPHHATTTIESNSLSETYNNSSPIESFLDVVSSPDHLSNYIVPVIAQQVAKIDDDDDDDDQGKTLPQQGKFLQAVLESGPLLQTLLVAGPLPRWRNPPQFKPCEGGMMNNYGQFGSSLINNTQPYFEMSCASSQMLSPYLAPNCNNFVHIDKRQRLQ
ncbi:hypothetical protein R3W88_033167 [Solanum pinnatisectum]|uniref:Uncharacterized protein n=1 Tax=Solanum pinnatisectum TaxID=50273 RepID=A0AAV9K1Q6_9SOLN|nr:hypothetical protein R3W88_033167 [Solanum pinnatisectum]